MFHLVAEETPADAAAQNPSAGTPAQSGDNQAQPGSGPAQGQRGGYGQGRGRGGRGFGGFMSQDYSSPVVADGKMYFTRRGGDVFVLALGREFKQLAINKFDGEADYSATPAIADGQIFIRSSKKLYCVANDQ